MPDLKMPDINNVLLAGLLVSDPILRSTTNGTPVINFYISANRKYRDNSGIWRENICNVGIVAWNTLAEKCNTLLKKGNSVLIEGELQSKKWTNDDGSTKNIVEIHARKIQLLDSQGIKVEELTEDNETVTSDTSTPQQEQEETPTQNDSENIKVEPTKFDFGYNDLKI